MDSEYIESPEIRYFVDEMLKDFDEIPLERMINYNLSDVSQKVILLPDITCISQEKSVLGLIDNFSTYDLQLILPNTLGELPSLPQNPLD